ncbi:diacylglycerol kinase [Gallaecimonas xiamenensis]|uniref:Diacylglycerol kinase n=1 Tax=Gallaecimonas xiamenensis 3-C-1 TaxID=745411 RepID=K2JD10_9GAMM|nr:diacylglycerol kinase [Gallaecimonas xiamenensis]EKE72988.1 Diacylglycerol kinase [Gallaecimonas xiamenensis 3-C-1]
MKPGHTGLKRILLAGRYSMQGLGAAWRSEAAVRQEIGLILLAVPASFFLPVTGLERALLIAAVLLVLVVELLNSAIEAVVDRIGPEYHELSGRAKDMGSAAVLITLLLAALVWLSILWP